MASSCLPLLTNENIGMSPKEPAQSCFHILDMNLGRSNGKWI